MTNGSAVIHINGAQYQLADQYTDPSSAGFQNLILRLEKMLGSNSAQIEHFDVKIDGHKGVLIIRSNQLVSAAVAFVPETEDLAHQGADPMSHGQPTSGRSCQDRAPLFHSGGLVSG